MTVADLAVAGDFVVLSYDVGCRAIRARKARATFEGQARVVRVITDKGIFELFAEQRVRMSSGGDVGAGELTRGMSLHAGAVDMAAGYLRVHLQNGRKGKKHFHRMAAELAGLKIDRMSVHHRDENKLNNRPGNLEVMTQADHAGHHGRKTASTGQHTFQTRSFSKSGDKNGMCNSSPFWKDAEKSKSHRQTQGRILKSSGRASGMQVEAARQKRCNFAFRILNAGYPIDTFEEYYAGFKAEIGPVGGSKARIRAAIDKAFGSFAQFVEEVRRRNHRVLAVEDIGDADVYAVVVDSLNLGHPDDPDGNFLIVSVGATTQVGSGIFVDGTPASPSRGTDVPPPTPKPPVSATAATVCSNPNTSATEA